MPIKADMPVDLPEDVPFLHRNLILNLQGLKFNEVGVYFIDVSIDGDVIQRLPLRIIKVDAKNNQQPPVA